MPTLQKLLQDAELHRSEAMGNVMHRLNKGEDRDDVMTEEGATLRETLEGSTANGAMIEQVMAVFYKEARAYEPKQKKRKK